ncbi:MAG: SDR family oxidoreductase [Pseudomonadota bacterium]
MAEKINRRAVLAAGAAIGGAAVSSQARAEPAPLDLSGQSVLITGTSSGFGRLAAEHLARLGAKVFATMRSVPRPEADELRDLASTDNLDLQVIEIDVTKPRQIASGMRRALRETDGKLDVLINNAGIAYGGSVEMQDEEAMQRIFDTNVFGPQRMARAALPTMRAQGHGLVINVSSQLGRVIFPGFSLYAPTKFALEAMSEQMAYEVAAQGIEVSLIQPGGYPTKIWDNALGLTEDLVDRTPEELKATYASYITGIGGGGGSTDPMDVPRAMAEIIALPQGDRPLRRPVHPGPKPQTAINDVSAQVQKVLLDRSGLGTIAGTVLD